MLIGIRGRFCLWLSAEAQSRHLARPTNFRLCLIDIGPSTPARIYILLLLGIATNIVGVPFYGTAVWAVSAIAFSIIPLTAFLWIVLAAMVRKPRLVDILLASIFFATRLVSSARFGATLGPIVVPVILVGLASVSVNRRPPWRTIGAVACSHHISATQQGKDPRGDGARTARRRKYGGGRTEMGGGRGGGRMDGCLVGPVITRNLST